jgi:DNA-binding IclR family transcriptional regulator
MEMKPLRPRPSSPDFNRSLERGVDLLRAFKPGSGLLGNGDLAERTGLARSTVSRLTQTLTACGLLEHDTSARAYRLAPAMLSMAYAMRSAHPVLPQVEPVLRELASRYRINAGLAAADRDEVVYLASVRFNQDEPLRHIAAGQRIPMALTALGRAYLSTLDRDALIACLARLHDRHTRHWASTLRAIRRSIREVHTQGWCAVSWQPEVVSLATPIHYGASCLMINVSMTTDAPLAEAARQLSPRLEELARQIQSTLSAHQITRGEPL